jgi:PAS domain S-box-containing protein
MRAEAAGVVFPWTQAHPMTAASSPSPARLLVVDDEEGLLFLISDALRREGYEVESLDSGEAALEWLRSHLPDLMLLDLKLGDLPAPTLVDRLRKLGREIPFVIITGHGDERTAVEVMKQGALDYVMKDKGLIELLPSVVRRALSVVERERKLIEANERLRQREQRHRKIVQTALDGFARFDVHGRFLEVNEALCELLGHGADEMLAMRVCDVETHAAAQLSAWLAECESDRGRFITRLRRSDGGVIDVEISLRREREEVFCFVHDISDQRRLEREVLQISEDERRRFGRDLHDGLGQLLTALELMNHTLARELKAKAPELAGSAEEIARYTRQAISQTRQLAHGLAPVALDAHGLMAALNDLAYLTSRTGVDCEFACPRPVSVHDSAAATHLYRIAQEAVNNALKHAGAKRIEIALEDRGSSVELSVQDDGRGLPPEPAARPGMGLQVIEYRARLVGGHLDVCSNPGQGVRIVCSLPKHL